MFDLEKLEGGIIPFEFAGEQGGKITIFAHAATREELSAASISAGLVGLADRMLKGGALDLDGSVDAEKVGDLGEDALEIPIREARLSVELACLCIESLSGEGIKEGKIPALSHVTNSHGLRRLSKESQAIFPRIILKQIGEKLNEEATLGEEENFPLEPLPTGSSTES